MGVPSIESAMVHAAVSLHEAESLQDMLNTLVLVVRDALPEIGHVGVTLAETKGPMQTAAATDGFVDYVDLIQYRLASGPCVDKLHGANDATVVDNVRHGGRDWPDFLAAAARAGVRSMMAVRLFQDERTVGVLNMYSSTHNTISTDSQAVARMFAPYAAAAYVSARTTHNLQRALETRELVGQAVGVVMERYRLEQAQAFQYLVRVSSTSQTKLRQVAQIVVDSAVTGAPIQVPVDPDQSEQHQG